MLNVQDTLDNIMSIYFAKDWSSFLFRDVNNSLKEVKLENLVYLGGIRLLLSVLNAVHRKI